MRLTDRLNLAQRVVLVIAIGLVLAVVGRYVAGLGHHGLTGWTGYAPLQAVAHQRGPHRWVRAAVWLALLVAWAAASVSILRTRPARSE